MFLPLSQLRRFVATDAPLSDIVEALEDIGHEVERVRDCSAFGPMIHCATIDDRSPHPGGQALSVYQVHTESQNLTVVSSNNTLEPGHSAVVALAGGVLAGQTIEVRDFDGVLSQGVFCSAAELDLPEPEWFSDSAGIARIFPDGITGTLDEVLGFPDSVILLKPTPNRGDCLSVLGLARELSARLQLQWQIPAWSPALARSQRQDCRHAVDSCQRQAEPVAIAEVSGTSYYALATLALPQDRDWSAQPSPSWLQEALRRFGQRPISILVDLSNYYLFVYGQPMHIFDADKITGALSVRPSQAGEIFTTLDHREISLHSDSLVIADSEKIIALAGIYGGDRAQIDGQTRRIAIECACFDPGSIRGRPRRYDLNTESAIRYERGVDSGAPDQVLLDCLEMVAQLIERATVEGVEVFRQPLPSVQVSLSRKRIDQYFGFVPEDKELVSTLEALGLELKEKQDIDGFEVQVPSWRSDISLDVCLIEELLRMGQMKNIQRRLGFSGAANETAANQTHTRQWSSMQKARRDFIARGFSEVCTYSFMSEKDDRVFFHANEPDSQASLTGLEGVAGFHTQFTGEPTESSQSEDHDPGVARIINPISSDMGVLRRSQIPPLCRLLLFHLNRQFEDLRLFETGSAFRSSPSGIKQISLTSGLIYGRAFPEQWSQSKRKVDFYELLGLLQNHLGQFVPDVVFDLQRSKQRHLHPLQSIDLCFEGKNYGYLGNLHPRIRQHYQFAGDVVVFELDNEIYRLTRPLRQAKTYSTAPHIRRDLSFLVPVDLPVSRLLAEIRSFGPENLQKASIFDLYRGPNIDSNYKSVSLLLIFNQKNTNLLELEVDQSCHRLVEHLRAQLDIQLRN